MNELTPAQLELEREKLRLESEKLNLERLRFIREQSLGYRLLQAGTVGLAALIPLGAALFALYGTLAGIKQETETSQRLRAAELVLADTAPQEITRRIAIVSRLMPEVRNDLAQLVDVDALGAYLSASIDAGYQLFWSADEARLEFFQAASEKAACAQEVAELWRLMFGPDRVKDVTSVPGYEWATAIQLDGVCPTP